METEVRLLSKFFQSVSSNPRIGPSHVSLYAALTDLWYEGGCLEPILIKRADAMLKARITAPSTYHRLLKDLVDGGCISYEPRFDRKGSRFCLK